MPGPAPRAVVVHRRSELDDLVARHGTRGQAEFFLRGRGATLAEVQERHDRLAEALREVRDAVPEGWRRGAAERGDLHRFVFEPQDVVVVVGPDGLVANVAKYLDGQPVVGVDPEPGRNPGVLVRHRATRVGALLRGLGGRGPGTGGKGTVRVEERALVRAELDDGTSLEALNDLYLGQQGHQSARYLLEVGGDGTERQSSSGLVVATGTGATGWAASLARACASAPELPRAASVDLAWFVREAWPSPTTGATLVAGRLTPRARLRVVAESDRLVVFGDGLEHDRLTVAWGQRVTVGVSDRRLRLVV